MCEIRYANCNAVCRLYNFDPQTMVKFQSAMSAQGIRWSTRWNGSVEQYECPMTGRHGRDLGVDHTALKRYVAKAEWASPRDAQKVTIAAYHHPGGSPGDLDPFWRIVDTAYSSAGGSLCTCSGWKE